MSQRYVLHSLRPQCAQRPLVLCRVRDAEVGVGDDGREEGGGELVEVDVAVLVCVGALEEALELLLRVGRLAGLGIKVGVRR